MSQDVEILKQKYPSHKVEKFAITSLIMNTLPPSPDEAKAVECSSFVPRIDGNQSLNPCKNSFYFARGKRTINLANSDLKLT